MSTVLVIDDSRAVRAYVHELLAGEHEILDAPDGRAGLEVIRLTPPDLVLLDIEMPGINGLDLLGMLDPGRLFTVILFTTRSSIDSIVAGLERGADDYIVKPFQPEEFRARVTAGLRTARRKRELDEARRTAEDALLRLEESERLCLARERMMAIASLASGAAHQINNPLGFVMSNLSVLERYAKRLVDALAELSLSLPEGAAGEILSKGNLGRITADIPQLIGESFQGLRRIARIVAGLSRLQPAMEFMERRNIDIAVMVDLVIEKKKKEYSRRRNITHRVGALSCKVDVAPLLIQDVLDILLSNAFEATEEEERIEVTTEADNGWVAVTVTNPAALGEETDPETFLAPFFSTKPPEEHAGLGLAVAERFVVSQGGEFLLEKTPNGEFRAIMRLPRVKPEGEGESET